MPILSMRVIREPKEGTRTIIAPDREVSPIVGEGDGRGKWSYSCGTCGFILVGHVAYTTSVVDTVFRCPRCKAFSETR